MDHKLWELRLKKLKTKQAEASPGTKYGSSGAKDSETLKAGLAKTKAP